MKTYKKVLVFLVAKTLRDITDHSLKLAKVFLKAIPYFVPMLPSILEPLSLIKILFPIPPPINR